VGYRTEGGKVLLHPRLVAGLKFRANGITVTSNVCDRNTISVSRNSSPCSNGK
jgi:hypothetical protein